MGQMTPEEIVKAKTLPEDAKFLLSLIRSMAKEIVGLQATVERLEKRQ
jgi:hypothetical protein